MARSEAARTAGSQGAYLLAVLMPSVFIGVMVGVLIPNRPPIQDRAVFGAPRV